ncbi:MAG TPA: HDOD domain-containing protein [Acidobacteriota bacterium]|nr:HDOD domain-containing protein [Acidobacteriota bacterium]
MTNLSIVEHIRTSGDLLSLPQALSELLREMERPEFSSETLANIILKDPWLTGRILKLANSSFYHRFSEITTVHQAVQLLGVTTVKCLALSSSVFNPGKIEKESGVDARAYFSRILTVAAASEKIAERTGYKAPEEAFIAGLLHDIGTMFFLHHYPDKYRLVVSRQTKARSLLDAEIEIFGINHCDVGFHLATKWGLPEHLVNAILDHHTPGRLDEEPLKNVLRLASLLSTDNVNGYGEDIEDRITRVKQVAGCLSLSQEDVDAISISLLSWTVSVAEYLGVDIGSIEGMLTRANQEIWQTYLMVENLFKERQELSQKLLKEEREKGAMESKNIAMATLSHYLNNAAMAIYGRSQLLRMQATKGDVDQLLEQLQASLNVVDRSVHRIVAVLAEIREISPIDQIEFLNTSQALNIDDRIEKRLVKMRNESDLVLPEEAGFLSD